MINKAELHGVPYGMLYGALLLNLQKQTLSSDIPMSKDSDSDSG